MMQTTTTPRQAHAGVIDNRFKAVAAHLRFQKHRDALKDIKVRQKSDLLAMQGIDSVSKSQRFNQSMLSKMGDTTMSSFHNQNTLRISATDFNPHQHLAPHREEDISLEKIFRSTGMRTSNEGRWAQEQYHYNQTPSHISKLSKDLYAEFDSQINYPNATFTSMGSPSDLDMTSISSIRKANNSTLTAVTRYSKIKEMHRQSPRNIHKPYHERQRDHEVKIQNRHLLTQLLKIEQNQSIVAKEQARGRTPECHFTAGDELSLMNTTKDGQFMIPKPDCKRIGHNIAMSNRRELIKIDRDNARIFSKLMDNECKVEKIESHLNDFDFHKYHSKKLSKSTNTSIKLQDYATNYVKKKKEMLPLILAQKSMDYNKYDMMNTAGPVAGQRSPPFGNVNVKSLQEQAQMPMGMDTSKYTRAELKKNEEKHFYKTHHIRNFDVQNQPIAELPEMQMFTGSNQSPADIE